MKQLRPLSTGIVLATVLLMLLVITLLSISFTSTQVMDERIGHNVQDVSRAFQAADSALIQGERWLQNQNTVPSTCQTTPCSVWASGVLANFTTQNSAWWTAHGVPYAGNLNGLNASPIYTLEQFIYIPDDLDPNTLAKGNGKYEYRVTAQGTGGMNQTLVYLQSIYATRFN